MTTSLDHWLLDDVFPILYVAKIIAEMDPKLCTASFEQDRFGSREKITPDLYGVYPPQQIAKAQKYHDLLIAEISKQDGLLDVDRLVFKTPSGELASKNNPDFETISSLLSSNSQISNVTTVTRNSVSAWCRFHNIVCTFNPKNDKGAGRFEDATVDDLPELIETVLRLDNGETTSEKYRWLLQSRKDLILNGSGRHTICGAVEQYLDKNAGTSLSSADRKKVIQLLNPNAGRSPRAEPLIKKK